jgi:hypothetical protein
MTGITRTMPRRACARLVTVGARLRLAIVISGARF